MTNPLVPWRKHSLRHDTGREESPIDILHREINELFDIYTGSLRRNRGDRMVARSGFELSETDDEIQVKAELPGMDEKDIHITIEDDVLNIRGERKEEKEKKKRNYHVSEISYGEYSRTIPLPREVDASKAKARFRRGVLTLSLPKTESARSSGRRIPVVAD